MKRVGTELETIRFCEIFTRFYALIHITVTSMKSQNLTKTNILNHQLNVSYFSNLDSLSNQPLQAIYYKLKIHQRTLEDKNSFCYNYITLNLLLMLKQGPPKLFVFSRKVTTNKTDATKQWNQIKRGNIHFYKSKSPYNGPSDLTVPMTCPFMEK